VPAIAALARDKDCRDVLVEGGAACVVLSHIGFYTDICTDMIHDGSDCGPTIRAGCEAAVALYACPLARRELVEGGLVDKLRTLAKVIATCVETLGLERDWCVDDCLRHVYRALNAIEGPTPEELANARGLLRELKVRSSDPRLSSLQKLLNLTAKHLVVPAPRENPVGNDRDAADWMGEEDLGVIALV